MMLQKFLKKIYRGDRSNHNLTICIKRKASYFDFFNTMVINEPNVLLNGDRSFSMLVNNPNDADGTNCL